MNRFLIKLMILVCFGCFSEIVGKADDLFICSPNLPSQLWQKSADGTSYAIALAEWKDGRGASQFALQVCIKNGSYAVLYLQNSENNSGIRVSYVSSSGTEILLRDNISDGRPILRMEPAPQIKRGDVLAVILQFDHQDYQLLKSHLAKCIFYVSPQEHPSTGYGDKIELPAQMLSVEPLPTKLKDLR